ncbi:MAG TPA: hypothetical protein PKM32_01810 [Planctomycetota bacterium]|nr:hypothetical protein [Planctomycetota bacterium]
MLLWAGEKIDKKTRAGICSAGICSGELFSGELLWGVILLWGVN